MIARDNYPVFFGLIQVRKEFIVSFERADSLQVC